MIRGKAKGRTNKTFIIQASLMIDSYDYQNIFIVEATGLKLAQEKHSSFFDPPSVTN
jgi:hypothetical protein